MLDPVPRATVADDLAFERMSACRPLLTGIATAAEALCLSPRTVLHAGPPIDATDVVCTPLLNAIAVAAVYEGWVPNLEAGLALARRGGINLASAQDHGAVVPLAAVLSPGMQVIVISDRAGVGPTICTPLNGGFRDAHRFGVAHEATAARVRWLNRELAPRIERSLASPVPLLPLAIESLARGDDCHGATTEATRLLGDALGGWHSLGRDVEQFMNSAGSFFLNPWMAASRCILGAAEGVPGAGLVTGMGGNGRCFGIRVAGDPRRWHIAAADAPRPPDASTFEGEVLPAIGDSAVVEALGLGAMARPDQAAAAVLHGRLASSFAAGLSARAVVERGTAPAINLGAIDGGGQRGMLGRGFVHPPLALFEAAVGAVSSNPSEPST